MAQQIEFCPYLNPAVEMLALSVLDAWNFERLMETDFEPTRHDELLVMWVNLVNTPVELLESH